MTYWCIDREYDYLVSSQVKKQLSNCVIKIQFNQWRRTILNELRNITFQVSLNMINQGKIIDYSRVPVA